MAEINRKQTGSISVCANVLEIHSCIVRMTCQTTHLNTVCLNELWIRISGNCSCKEKTENNTSRYLKCVYVFEDGLGSALFYYSPWDCSRPLHTHNGSLLLSPLPFGSHITQQHSPHRQLFSSIYRNHYNTEIVFLSACALWENQCVLMWLFQAHIIMCVHLFAWAFVFGYTVYTFSSSGVWAVCLQLIITHPAWAWCSLLRLQCPQISSSVQRWSLQNIPRRGSQQAPCDLSQLLQETSSLTARLPLSSLKECCQN